MCHARQEGPPRQENGPSPTKSPLGGRRGFQRIPIQNLVRCVPKEPPRTPRPSAPQDSPWQDLRVSTGEVRFHASRLKPLAGRLPPGSVGRHRRQRRHTVTTCPLSVRGCFTLFHLVSFSTEEDVSPLKTPRGYLTVRETMKRLGAARVTLWRMVRRKELSVARFGFRRFFKISEVERFQ